MEGAWPVCFSLRLPFFLPCLLFPPPLSLSLSFSASPSLFLVSLSVCFLPLLLFVGFPFSFFLCRPLLLSAGDLLFMLPRPTCMGTQEVGGIGSAAL